LISSFDSNFQSRLLLGAKSGYQLPLALETLLPESIAIGFSQWTDHEDINRALAQEGE